jgi:predicted aconitase with swiveling domain
VRVEPVITIGNVVSMAISMVTLIAFFITLNANVTNNSKIIQELKEYNYSLTAILTVRGEQIATHTSEIAAIKLMTKKSEDTQIRLESKIDNLTVLTLQQRTTHNQTQ